MSGWNLLGVLVAVFVAGYLAGQIVLARRVSRKLPQIAAGIERQRDRIAALEEWVR